MEMLSIICFLQQKLKVLELGGNKISFFITVERKLKVSELNLADGETSAITIFCACSRSTK